MLDEAILDAILKNPDLKPNEREILKALRSGDKTARQIKEETNIQISHVHTNLKNLHRTGLVEEKPDVAKGHGNVYRISLKGLLDYFRKADNDLKVILEERRTIEEKLESLVKEESGIPHFKAVVPELLNSAAEVHEKIVQLLNKHCDLIVSTRAPYLWFGNFHGSNNYQPFPGTESFWKTQMDFLQRSINDKKYRLTYLVDVEEYIKILNKKSENDRISSIRAILECLKGINRGWNLTFAERPSEGLRLTPLAFVESANEGYFVLSVADTDNIVTKGLFFQNRALAEIVASHQAIALARQNSRETLIGMANKVMSEAVMPDEIKKELRSTLAVSSGKKRLGILK